MITSRTLVLRIIKAVFFDWFNTLADFKPSRQELYIQAFQQFGFELSFDDVTRGVLAGDRYIYNEIAKSPLDTRSPREQMETYLCYPRAIVAEAKIQVPEEFLPKILMIVRERYEKESTFVLFDDVLSTLALLKDRGLILGLLTNATRESLARYRHLGLHPYLDVIVTSAEVGAEKPKPPIFLKALEEAGVNAQEAMHVGDQYEIDILGARDVGISPVLIDRYGVFSDVEDCPRICRLAELVEFL